MENEKCCRDESDDAQLLPWAARVRAGDAWRIGESRVGESGASPPPILRK